MFSVYMANENDDDLSGNKGQDVNSTIIDISGGNQITTPVVDFSQNLYFSLFDTSRGRISTHIPLLLGDMSGCLGTESDINKPLEDMSNNMTSRIPTNRRRLTTLFEALDNSAGPRGSSNVVDDGEINTRRDIRRLIDRIGLQYDSITGDSKNFAGWDPKTVRSRSCDIDFERGNYRSPGLILPPPTIQKEKINIDVEITGLSDLLKLIDDYPLMDNVEYNINMKPIHAIKEPLVSLDKMIGMNALKDNIVDQIIYYVQEFHKRGKAEGDFMHTVIYGPPGTGKTEIAKIIGSIFSKLGILTKGSFRKVTRSDLIAGYLGQTALKTRDVVKDALGGVLFIDEAYALGNSEKRDSFAKECIDTLNECLSDHKDNLMVIIAGYEQELKTCFFDYNQGLESRFTWRFKTDDYTFDELHKIFLKKVDDAGWTMDESIPPHWFKDNMEYFKYFGRDMETLFAKTKICHSRRVFCKSQDSKTKLTKSDIDKGLALYLTNDEVKSRKDESYKIVQHMYV